MRDVVERYVRSLAEREPADDGPEELQDLGTFLGWLLPRRGYTIHLAAWKQEGPRRRKSAGRRQWGVDLIASAPDRDGTDRLHLFVLKKGNVTPSNWHTIEPGSLGHDLMLAAGLGRTLDARSPGIDATARRVVVAVHNGDRDEDLGPIVEEYQRQLAERHDIDFEWWDARRLVDEALAPDEDGETLDRRSDASIFPPTVRPFARLALDSLRRGEGGARFDYDAVDQFLETRLPLGRVPSGGIGRPLPDGEPIRTIDLRRSAAEIELFAQMVAVEAVASADGSTVATLDTIERACCRIVEHLRRVPSSDRHRPHVRATLDGLLETYASEAATLARRLDPLRSVPLGLALNTDGEPIDYPLRCLRFGGYLAVAGHLAADSSAPDAARSLAALLLDLWTRNPGGFASPVTDDQVIELVAVWSLWDRVGMRDAVASAAAEVVLRLAVRRMRGRPLPAVWQWARVPMREPDRRLLVDVYLSGDAPGFTDEGSTILPFALAICWERGRRDVEPWVGQLTGSPPPLTPQVWVPPDDAAREWYAAPVATRGFTHTFVLGSGCDGVVKGFRDAARASAPESFAAELGLGVLDLVAWKRWRTLPALAELCRVPIP